MIKALCTSVLDYFPAKDQGLVFLFLIMILGVIVLYPSGKFLLRRFKIE